MPASIRHSWNLVHCFRTIGQVPIDLCQRVFLFTRSRRVPAAENLFLRKQLALFEERKLKPHRADDSTRWLTFVCNHAQVIVACDFLVVVTARFRILYVLVIMELGNRKILHHNVTMHPTAEWTAQQFREALPGGPPYRFVIHDRDSIFSPELDKAVADMGVRILRTPVRAPKANSVCERLVGTLRRECLDFIIPLGKRHLRRTLQVWIDHYNRGRPHMSLGPGIPAPLQAPPPHGAHRHGLPAGQLVRSKAVLGGLHHEYWLEKVAA